MNRRERNWVRRILFITILFFLTACYYSPGPPQPFSCARFGESYWEEFKFGVDSPSDVIAIVIRQWGLDKDKVHLDDTYQGPDILEITWSDDIGVGLGANYSAVFRSEPQLLHVNVWWAQDHPRPALVQVIDCLGTPQYYDAYYQQEAEGQTLVLGLWYMEKGFVVNGSSSHLLALPSAIQPEYRMKSFTVTTPGSPEQMVTNANRNSDDPDIQGAHLCRLRPWPGSLEEIDIEAWSTPCNWQPD